MLTKQVGVTQRTGWFDQEPLERVGVSFKQQLIEANFYDDFIAAADKRDSKQMIALLVQIGKKKRTAAFIVHAIFANAQKFGY